MKILFCAPCPLDRKLGAAKMLMELAEALQAFGWEATLVGPPDVGAQSDKQDYAAKLYPWVRQRAADFDVIDFDAKFFPLERSDFSPTQVLVARAQLLRHNEVYAPRTPIVDLHTALDFFKHELYKRRREAELPRMNRTFQQADLATVLNRHAREALVAQGVDPGKVHVFPNGMQAAQRAAFDVLSPEPPSQPRVAFIGMFGPRKGAADLPDVFRRIHRVLPVVQYRLLGTQGMYNSAEAVRAKFAPALRTRIEVVPTFEPETLPRHLADCSIGVLPTYAEGFPLAVLEMLAAAIPVFSYDVPGPPEMLSSEFILPPRDTRGMAARMVALLQDPARLKEARVQARNRAHMFTWPAIAEATDQLYRQALAARRAPLAAARA
jgi:glycosyltransferase involved in cell wall biosynthesis